MIDWAEVGTAGLVSGTVGGLLMLAMRSRRERALAQDPPDPLADSPAVEATLVALGPTLAPSGDAGWLTVALGGERPAVEALVQSLRPGLPVEGPFSVKRLVASAPVRLDGHVTDGVEVITSVARLDVPDHTA
jgi:hypothetical protein